MVNNTSASVKKELQTEAAKAQKEKISTLQFTEVTAQLLTQIQKGQICQFGQGWLFRCPKCETLIFTDDEFKALMSPKQAFYRLAPSVVCPNPTCEWHAMLTIRPEDEILEVEEEKERSEEKKKDDTQPAVVTP